MALAHDVALFRQRDQIALPKWYRWHRHLLLHFTLFSVSFIGVFIWANMVDLEWSLQNTLLLFSLVLVWANIEYLIHRFILHGSSSILRRLAREHSFNHHHYFTNQDMFATQRMDLNRILLMPQHLFGVLILNAIVSSVLSLFAAQLAVIFCIAGILYSALYEVIHGISHHSSDTKSPWFDGLRSHHRQHHDLKTMGSTNFAVVFPIVDSIWGTHAPN